MIFDLMEEHNLKMQLLLIKIKLLHQLFKLEII
jgi:hypothetical protein